MARRLKLLAAVLLACGLQALPAAAQPAAAAPPGGLPTVPILPNEVLADAAVYQRYVREAAALTPAFADGAAIARSLRTGAAYEPAQLSRGAIGYAALAALADPAFTRSVRAAASDDAARKALAAELLANPRAAARFDRTGGAAGRAAAALFADGGGLQAAGKRVVKSAYDLHATQAWSAEEVSDRVERLAGVKSLSAGRRAASSAEVDSLLQQPLAAPGDQPAAGAVARPLVARAVALAALAVLGEADLQVLQPVLNDSDCATCLRMSKLNLFQCLAVAKPWYEDVFCLGQHILVDTGDCIQSAGFLRRAGLGPLRREEQPGETADG